MVKVWFFLSPTGPLRTMACGALGGVSLWLAVFPADVVKSRLQVQTSAESSFLSTLVAIFKNEGTQKHFLLACCFYFGQGLFFPLPSHNSGCQKQSEMAPSPKENFSGLKKWSRMLLLMKHFVPQKDTCPKNIWFTGPRKVQRYPAPHFFPTEIFQVFKEKIKSSAKNLLCFGRFH